jgi:hypothetical protein
MNTTQILDKNKVPIAWVREQTSIRCFVAKKLVEPILGRKANEAA